MKPRFSILTVLGVTAFLGIQLATWVSIDSYWPDVAFLIFAALMVGTTVIACGKTNGRSIFARAFLFGMFLCEFLRVQEPGYYDRSRPKFFNWYRSLMDYDAPFFASYNADTLLITNLMTRMNSLAFGLICGFLALWYYERQERREKQPHSND
jgi:hypothetical protein